jgi:hypothetical protein
MSETTSTTRLAFTVHDRQLVIATNDAFVSGFLREAYRRSLASVDDGSARIETGEVRAANDGYRLIFDGQEQPWPIPRPAPGDAFLAAFYGSRELFRLCAQRIESCWPVYGAAVEFGQRAVLLLGASGIGKTTLALALVQRGALLYGDECIFINKSTAEADGLARALMIRESALGPLSFLTGLRSACGAAPFHTNGEARLWYAVDPNRIFNRDVSAAPARLGAVIVLGERAAAPAITPLPNSVGALMITQRSHVKASALDELASTHRALERVACYRVSAATPDDTAALVLATLGSAA